MAEQEKPADGQTPPAQAEKKTEAAPAAPAPNIQFVGKKSVKNAEGKYEDVYATPPKSVTLAGKKYKLPKADEQTAGFYHKDATKIKRALPEQFKTPVSKGKDGGAE